MLSLSQNIKSGITYHYEVPADIFFLSQKDFSIFSMTLHFNHNSYMPPEKKRSFPASWNCYLAIFSSFKMSNVSAKTDEWQYPCTLDQCPNLSTLKTI